VKRAAENKQRYALGRRHNAVCYGDIQPERVCGDVPFGTRLYEPKRSCRRCCYLTSKTQKNDKQNTKNRSKNTNRE